MVSGAIALLLEANPTLTPAEVKEILLDNARNDNLTGDIGPAGHVRWGHGKLDILQAIQTMLNVGTEDVSEGNHNLFPNPSQDIVYVDKALKGNETYCVYNINGEILSQGKFNGFVSLAEFSEGAYVLQVTSEDGVDVYKVVTGNR